MDEQINIVILSFVLGYLRIYTEWLRHCTKYYSLILSIILTLLFFFLIKPFLQHFLILFIYLFLLCWVLISVRGLSLVAASGGHSSSRYAGLSLSWPLLLRSTGSRRAGSVVVAHRPSCSAACGIFPDQGSNPCPLHWQADSQPLHHQGSPILTLLISPLYETFLRLCCQQYSNLNSTNERHWYKI